MSLNELVESDGYKKLMAKVVGWGASVVLVGALFKIQHWPGASIMLIIGLLTEALIFFLTAFDPLHEEVDWSLVYPELAGLDELDDEMTSSKHQPKEGPYALERFDELLENSNLGTELFDKLGAGMSNLSKAVTNISDITDATIATDLYAKNITVASDSVSKLSGAFDNSADAINKTSRIVGESGNSYQALLEGLNANMTSIGSNSKAQAEQQEMLTKNLSALNAVYELQLKSSNDNLHSTEEVAKGITGIMQDLKATSQDVAQYKDEVSKLSKNLSALNTIYGNMLNAMNVK